MSTTSQLDESIGDPIDGRTARAMRTRDRLVDATIELVDEGDVRPTAPRIAERAGVSVRSVFQHFDDLETLFAAMGQRVFHRLAALIEPIDPAGSLVDRVDAFVAQRSSVHEAITPINRAAILQQPTSDTIDHQFRQGHAFVRAHVAEVFGTELAAAGPGAHDLLTALVVALSWPAWNLLRTYEGCDVDEAHRAVLRSVELVLAGAGFPLERPAVAT